MLPNQFRCLAIFMIVTRLSNAFTLYGLEFINTGPPGGRGAWIVEITDNGPPTCPSPIRVCKIFEGVVDDAYPLAPVAPETGGAEKHGGLTYIEPFVYWGGVCEHNGETCSQQTTTGGTTTNRHYMVQTNLADCVANSGRARWGVESTDVSVAENGMRKTLAYGIDESTTPPSIVVLGQVAGTGNPPHDVFEYPISGGATSRFCNSETYQIQGDGLEYGPAVNGPLIVSYHTGGNAFLKFYRTDGDNCLPTNVLNVQLDYTNLVGWQWNDALKIAYAKSDLGCYDYYLYLFNTDTNELARTLLGEAQIEALFAANDPSIAPELRCNFVGSLDVASTTFSDIARMEIVFVPPPNEDGECEAQDFDFDILGHSGKVMIYNGDNRAQLTMGALWEFDEDGRKINDPGHSINSFANQEFYWFDLNTEEKNGLNARHLRFFSCIEGNHNRQVNPDPSSQTPFDASGLSQDDDLTAFCEANHGVTAWLAVDIWQFIECEGESVGVPEVVTCGDDEDTIQPGQLKWGVTLNNYEYCDGRLGDERACGTYRGNNPNKGNPVVAARVQFDFEFKWLSGGSLDYTTGDETVSVGAWDIQLDDILNVFGTDWDTSNLAARISDDEWLKVSTQGSSVVFSIDVAFDAEELNLISRDSNTLSFTYDPLIKEKHTLGTFVWPVQASASEESNNNTYASLIFVVAAPLAALVALVAAIYCYVKSHATTGVDELMGSDPKSLNARRSSTITTHQMVKLADIQVADDLATQDAFDPSFDEIDTQDGVATEEFDPSFDEIPNLEEPLEE